MASGAQDVVEEEEQVEQFDEEEAHDKLESDVEIKVEKDENFEDD